MCRMLAFSSKVDVKVTPFFVQLKEMARSGKKSPHPDGWGFFCRDSLGNIFYNRSIIPIFEDKFPVMNSMLCLMHARKASPGTSKGIFSVHPFLFIKDGKVHAIAHNGSVRLSQDDREGLKTGVDTEMIIRLISNHGLDAVPGRFSAGSSSATLLLTDGEYLTVFRCCWKSCDYYTLFLREEEGLVVISSEGEGREMENGELAVVRGGKVIYRKIMDCQRGV